ncbi:ribonuclease P protein component [Crocinitomicaceae bacterium]|jgi:ribonuclease P protein component|nr:ribonuclease P protein component [Crocinitomicaceae bacterium]
MDQTFGKEYKLCSQKKIESLFKTGKLVKKFPLIVHFQEVEETLSKPFQIVISAPKRIYRKAHDRNRIKRLMREAVRKNKNILESYLIPKNKNIILFLVYTNKEEIPLDILLKKTEQLFNLVIQNIDQNEISNVTN